MSVRENISSWAPVVVCNFFPIIIRAIWILTVHTLGRRKEEGERHLLSICAEQEAQMSSY